MTKYTIVLGREEGYMREGGREGGAREGRRQEYVREGGGVHEGGMRCTFSLPGLCFFHILNSHILSQSYRYYC